MPHNVGKTPQEIRRQEEQARAFTAGRERVSRVDRLLRTDIVEEPPFPPFPDPTGGGGATLSFAQTEAGARLAASLSRETERVRGRERLKLEDTLFSLAKELLPPKDVETAMLQVRRGELVKSKLAFQAVLENLADAERNAERRRDLELAEENEKRTLTAARSQIVINMIGKDLGRAVLFALSGSTSAGGE